MTIKLEWDIRYKRFAGYFINLMLFIKKWSFIFKKSANEAVEKVNQRGKKSCELTFEGLCIFA